MKRIYLITTICMIAVTTACYRETGIEVLPVTGSQTTSDNTPTLVRGRDASARKGDYILKNNQLEIVVNGDLFGHSRDLYMPHSGGSIIDVSTQYEKGGNRVLTPRDDDGLNQLSQGVNMNRNTPIGYERLRIDAPDETAATMTLTGRVYDLDGSLTAQGASVDSQGRVNGCTVTTQLYLADSTTVSSSTITRPVFHVKMTTIVSNTSGSTLPIHDVNDIVFTTHEAANTFIPYPDWGFKRPTNNSSLAWPNYVQIQPRQLNTTHYGFISKLDGVLKVREENVPSLSSDVLYVGKAVTPQSLAPGEAITFVREFFAASRGDSGQSLFPSQSFFLVMEEHLVDTEDVNNPFRKIGRVTVGLRADDERDRMEGSFQFEYIGRTNYFDGTHYKLLEPGRTFPIFGDSPVTSKGNSVNPSYEVYLPGGQLAVRANTLNTDEVYSTKRQVPKLDQNGVALVDENGVAITEDVDIIVVPKEGFSTVSLSAGALIAGKTHKRFRFSVDNTNARDLYARVNIERVDENVPVQTGLFPTDRQGNVYYVDQNTPSSSTNSSFIDLPKGIYEALISRGPLSNVNILRINNKDSKPTGSTDTQYSTSFNIELGEAMTLPGYFSADFDVRGSADPLGMVNELQLMLLAYAEDIDVLFFSNTNAQSTFKDLFVAHGRTAGNFNKADQDNKVDSWFDEVAYARALATIGKVGGSYPDRGRFSLFNLPKEESGDYLEVPLMDSDPASFYSKARKISDKVLIQISRPRAPRGLETGFFTAIAEMSGLQSGQPIPGDNEYYTRTAENGSNGRWIDFDLVEVLAGRNYDEYLLARQDWFNLLNAGYFKPATGGSSTGQTRDLPIGAVRTYVAVSNTSLRDNDLTEFWDSASKGHSFVTNGPILAATINSASFGDTAQVSGTSASAHVVLRAAPWVPVEELRVIVDGQVVLTQPITSAELVRFEGNIDVPLPDDNQRHWVVFEAGSSLSRIASGTPIGGTYQRVMPGHLPIAFSNPIFVE